ncbi:hypothetical protein AT1G07060 [Arabidopsis thaliana]|uniref:Protein DOUBLE-STRAND BREAK FORMATION n=2 Tax=Arabidopsis thaliana TaxID=3702 RepID=DFO_ARATH|nr:uncharacterized protein AT1G07060 [Arabidopsis thaliana]Q8RX33.1 RecName: Full=Protein DOUBLE-STRAND BREAK FORMATION; Short=AtDFO; Short=Protein DSB FORMATION [Arabidopsis thaliana]AAM13919.1 unknown protein [Arabidopsis thaliana]AEE28073.1 hypothetical protein AT1G07060 [Arabidopsis thaliana]|eukprot:NP_172187.1 hypothetical protein AT1G07060 [Arabidopsis thaliana]
MRHNIKFKSKGTLKIRNTAQISLWKKCSDSMIADQTYLFINRVQDRRFDEESLRILELSLVAMNVKSFLEVRSRLRDFMRSESVVIFGELTGESMVAKLSVLEFFARAFALLGDMESCLAMRYEALNLRQLKSPSCLWLGVSHSEWTKFAVQSMENGFPSIAGKASENALLSLKKDSLIEPKSEDNSDILDAAEKVRRLRDSAASLTSSHSGIFIYIVSSLKFAVCNRLLTTF